MTNFYLKLRPLLFKLNPETANDLVLFCLQKAPFLVSKVNAEDPVELMGISFPNRIGLAAGLDRNGIAIPAFDRMGFGFIEVGTATPKSQTGNGKPRVFRLPEHEAIINRRGFDNLGIKSLVGKVANVKHETRAPIGISLGKSELTTNEKAIVDYKIGIEYAYRFADYITINLSSLDTVGSSHLPSIDALKKLFEQLKTVQSNCQARHRRYVPLVVKIPADSDEPFIKALCESVSSAEIDGIIATGATTERPEVSGHKFVDEEGELSGKPLILQSNLVLHQIRAHLPNIPLIASGGVMSAADYHAKLNAGADLVQLYTGLIYHGPKLVRDCLGIVGK